MLVLASASPRRHELLRNAGIEFDARPADVPETPLPGEGPLEMVCRLACKKARVVWEQVCRENVGGKSLPWVLGADTTVVVGQEMLAKPAGADDAARMLRLLSGRTHQVMTAVCLIGQENGRDFGDVRAETTQVTMQALRESDIRDYIAHGEPMDKAGAYAIQGIASRWISRIEGCYFNVVGLPVPLVCKMLREHGQL